ncbi:chitinase-3-like protein 1 [Wyeomyia smithii]|uniref:chitinase-3-like protein 1 n=1 Tax=Wyeomyia smithii TaxID=174621 RepID=UPI002467C624|nr:chitinase-3-like protein 1 [Wyeomyia smithii]
MTVLIGLWLIALVVPLTQAEKNVVCYYGSWSSYRHGNGQFVVDRIDPLLCTHLIYSFVGVNANGTVRVLDPWLDLEDNWGLATMKKFTSLKKINTNLKTLVAVGGWNVGSETFSDVAQNAVLRARFAQDAAEFCVRHEFDGLDVDWEYPAQRDGDPMVDRDNFVHLLSDLRQELSKRGLLLTAAVAAAETSASISYNIPEISKYLDFINLMTYDLHGPWEATTGHHAALHAGPNDVTVAQQQLNVESCVMFWLAAGAPAEKLNLGVAFYGRTFTLRSASENHIGALSSGPGQGGLYSQELGFLGYNEICEKLLTDRWYFKWDEDQQVPYAFSGNQWVGFDNAESLTLKCDLVNLHGLAGAMVWSIETDDFNGRCGDKFGLLGALRAGLKNGDTITSVSATTLTKEPTTVSAGTMTTTETSTAVSSTAASSEFNCSVTGFFRDPMDSAKFYYCDDLTRHDFHCPFGTYFDITILACDWASNVQC